MGFGLLVVDVMNYIRLTKSIQSNARRECISVNTVVENYLIAGFL